MITRLVDFFVNTIKDFDRSMFALAGGLGPWVVPIAPALVYAFVFYSNTIGQMGWIALAGAVAIGVGLVVAGAMSSHTAMSLHSFGASRGKVLACWSLVVGYIVLEIGGLVVMNTFGGLKVVGVTASALTLIVYLSRSFNEHLKYLVAEREASQQREVKSAEASAMLDIEREKAQIEFEREKELLQLKLKHEQKMAKIESSGDVSKPVSKPVSKKLSDDEQKAAIYQAMRDNPDIKMTHLAGQIGVSRSTLYNRLGEMQDDGTLYKNGTGLKVK